MSIMNTWNKNFEDSLAGKLIKTSSKQNEDLAKISNCSVLVPEVFDYIFEVAEKQDDRQMSELAQHFSNRNKLNNTLIACNNLLTITAFNLENFEEAVAIFLKNTYLYAKEISKNDRELFGSFMTCYLSSCLIVTTKDMQYQKEYLVEEGREALKSINEKVQTMLTEM